MPPDAQDTIAVVLPRAEADPHGSLRLGATTYRAGFEALGYRALTVDLETLTPADVDALRSPRVRAILSDGGWINAVKTRSGGGNGGGGATARLVESLEAPVVALINDNPCAYWMPEVLPCDRPNQTTAFIDADFSTLWSRWAPEAGTRQLYVPACPVQARDQPDEWPPGGLAPDERPIDTLAVLSLSARTSHREVVRRNFTDPLFHRLFDGIVELGLDDGLRPFSAVCDEVCGALGIRLDYGSLAQRFIVYAADAFIRDQRRRVMLERLAAHPITLVGGGEGARLHPDSRVLARMSHAAVLDLYHRARRVVVSPPYSGGISERIIQPMAAGALVVAPPTRLGDQVFGRDRLFVTVATDFSDLDQGLERAGDPAVRSALVQAARADVSWRFSPAACAARFLGHAGAPPLFPASAAEVAR